MRASAFGWRGSAKAIERLKSASAEIRAVNRADPVTAAEGVIALAARIWPAFEHIDTSSGALGTAVRRTLDDLVPILIAAPADEKTRAKWLEQLRTAIEDDGVDYLAPISDRFGEIAVFPALMNLHADRDLDLIQGPGRIGSGTRMSAPRRSRCPACSRPDGMTNCWRSSRSKRPGCGSMTSSGPKPCSDRAARMTHWPMPRRFCRGIARHGAITTSAAFARRSLYAKARRTRPIAGSACPQRAETPGWRCGAIWSNATLTGMPVHCWKT